MDTFGLSIHRDHVTSFAGFYRDYREQISIHQGFTSNKPSQLQSSPPVTSCYFDWPGGAQRLKPVYASLLILTSSHYYCKYFQTLLVIQYITAYCHAS